jgi:hypothetical protein
MAVESAYEARIIGAGHGDNSELRARLSGRRPEGRSVETELRLAMLEREEVAELIQTQRGRKNKSDRLSDPTEPQPAA